MNEILSCTHENKSHGVKHLEMSQEKIDENSLLMKNPKNTINDVKKMKKKKLSLKRCHVFEIKDGFIIFSTTSKEDDAM